MLIGKENEANRVKWLKKTLSKIRKGKRILDAGAGELRFRELCGHLDYVSQDFGQYDGKGDGAGLQRDHWDNTKLDIVSDITDIPEKDESFDAIMCVEVFEHLPYPIKAVEEFARLLKKDGLLVITAPFCSLTHFAPYHFYTGFNRYFYEKVLGENGFEIVELSRNGDFFAYLGQEIRRLIKTPIVYAKKGLRPLVWLVLLLALPFLLITLIFLTLFQKMTKGSDELLCHGYHVVAKKISPHAKKDHRPHGGSQR